jgi:hypothetical protein
MLLAAALAAAVSSSAPALPMSQRDQVRQVLVQRYGPKVQVYSILIKSGYAVAQGTGFHDGLKKSGSRWQIVCSKLPAGQLQPTTLQSHCGFPESVAVIVSTEEPVNMAVAQGDFSTAMATEQKAYASSTGPTHDAERVRLQQLTQLNEQMRTQTITRQQAIQQWSQLEFSWSLP